MNFSSLRGLLVFISLLAGNVSTFAQDSKIDSLLALLTTAHDTAEVVILNQLSERSRSKSSHQSVNYAKDALQKAEAVHFPMGQVNALHNLGIGEGFNNNFVAATDYLIRSAEAGEKIGVWKSVADNYTNIGSMYAVQGNNEKWLEYYLKALKVYEEIQDKKGIASILYGIGNSLASEKKFDQALENYLKSIQYFEQLNLVREIPKVYVNLGTMYDDKGDYPKSIEYFGKALDGFASYNNGRGRAMALIHRGSAYFHAGQIAAALADLKEAVALGQKLNHQIPVVDAKLQLGRIYQSRQDYQQALIYVAQAKLLAIAIQSRSNVAEADELLADLYSAIGDFKNAYHYQGLHNAIIDSLEGVQKSRQIQEMQVRYETEKKEKEIEILQEERFRNTIYFTASVATSLVIILVGFLIINRQQVIIRKDRELSYKEGQIVEERRSLMEAELLNRQLTEDQLRQQIEFNNREMTTYALNLIQKNELLDNIKDDIENIRSAEGDQIKSKLQSLVNTVNYSFHLDKDWETFRMHFEQVHQCFFDKLQQLFPELGANDIKLCALLRLNLDTKAMATVLDISPESAKVARHRLRKKLNLPTEQNLSSYLSSL